MADILPRELPVSGPVNPNAVTIVDDGTTVNKATPIQLVDAAIPLASQADAEAGTDNVKRMTPLRVRQASQIIMQALVSGQIQFSLPDEANGDTIPAVGSRLPYLSAGVLKIA